MINVQNTDDNECFRWCLVRYLNPADQEELQKLMKSLQRVFFFKDMKFPVKTRHIPKIGKKNSISISVCGYENQEKYPIYVPKKCCEEKHVE